MKTLSPDEIDLILRDRKFDELIDVLETDELDFKDQPYPMETDRQKYDLVEDITAFANHEGGLIILGCRTASVPDLEGDVVTDVRLVPQNLCQFEVWRSICNQLIYPPIKGLTFRFHEVPEDPNRGLVAITVPKSPEADRPHLLAHIMCEGLDRKITTKYGLIVRTGARNSSFAVANIHALIQSGSAVSKVESSLSSIEEKLANLLSERSVENPRGREFSLDRNRRKFLEKIPPFLESIGRDNYPTLVLGAFPSEEMVVNEIYDGGSIVSAAFDKSPELRENGFGLNSYSQSELIGGVARRVVSGMRKGRELSNSGRLLVGVAADDDFLGWATNRKKGYPLRYRSYVLAEVTYIFAAYVRQIFDAISHKPRHLDILVALRNSFIDDLPPQLGVAADHHQFHHSWIEPKSAPKENLFKSVRVPIDITVERLAFETRACLYRRFGFGDDLIPYATLTAEGRTTTSQHILDPNLR